LAAVAVYPVAAVGAMGLEAALGAAAALILVAALLARVAALVPLALGAFIAEYAVLLVRRDDIDPFAPLVAAGVVVAAEAAFTSLAASRVELGRALLLRRSATVAGAAVGACACGFFLLGISQLRAAGGLGLQAVGLTAAAAALALVILAARR
jgi:hypothetical protein